ncbi:MAG: BrnT family toxin [Treponema sp.]|jgi:uncharacterized DUF497 family protein|nr:BrnT family toxin [Treponema sp.]
MILRFEWDDEKNSINKIKHGISFENAKMVFFDPMAIEIYDIEHSLFERRWMAVGLAGLDVLMVSFTERNNSIRIISARKADRHEEEKYFYGYSTGNSI